MFRGAQQTCLGPHHLKVSQGRLASPGCVHWSLLSPEPREKIRAVSHRSTRHALSSAWNTVSVTQPRLSLHSLVHTMDLSLHSSIYLDGSILFWAWNGSYAFPFTALYNTTQHACLLRALYTRRIYPLRLVLSESFTQRKARLPIYRMDCALVAMSM